MSASSRRTSFRLTVTLGITVASRSARPDAAVRMYARSERSAPVVGSGSLSARRMMSPLQSAGMTSGGSGCVTVRYTGMKAIRFVPSQAIGRSSIGGDTTERRTQRPSTVRSPAILAARFRPAARQFSTSERPCSRTDPPYLPPRWFIRGAGVVHRALQDSNRRPPPFHALRSATGRNRRQRFWLVRAVFGARAFATGCHWLRPLGSINAPSPSPESRMNARFGDRRSHRPEG
jgi:hypothetical protein